MILIHYLPDKKGAKGAKVNGRETETKIAR